MANLLKVSGNTCSECGHSDDSHKGETTCDECECTNILVKKE